VAPALGDERKAEALQDADDLAAGQPTKLGHGLDQFRG
jgi:hypothetical protein